MEGSRDFDFLHGRWKVAHRKLWTRLASCDSWYCFSGTMDVDPILDGLGNFDVNDLADPLGSYVAHSMRLFSPCRRLWSIWWLDGRAPSLEPPVEGRFDGGKGSFFANEMFNGRPIRVRTTYEPTGDATAQWTQAFSDNGGTSWEINWIMDFEKTGS